MTDTLLVLAGDRKAFDKWTRNWGVRLKNTSVMKIESEDDINGWEGNVYYTVLPGYSSQKNGANILTALEDSDHKLISSKTIESRLKGVNIKHQPTQ